MNVSCFESAGAFCRALCGGCIISDVPMPEISGLDLLRQLQEAPATRGLLLMTGHGDVELAVRGDQARRIRLRRSHSATNASCERRAGAYRLGNFVKSAPSSKDLKAKFQSLSDRQRDTMQLLVQGLSNKEIGQKLGISPRTVKIHRTWVMTKMSARSMCRSRAHEHGARSRIKEPTRFTLGMCGIRDLEFSILQFESME